MTSNFINDQLLADVKLIYIYIGVIFFHYNPRTGISPNIEHDMHSLLRNLRSLEGESPRRFFKRSKS